MTPISRVDLDSAEEALAIANTSLFLLRKLRADEAPEIISAAYSPTAIFAALCGRMAKKPRTLRDAVAPFVYAVALARQGQLQLLHKALQVPASEYDWLPYLIGVLIETTPSTTTTTIQAPVRLYKSRTSKTSKIAPHKQRLELTQS